MVVLLRLAGKSEANRYGSERANEDASNLNYPEVSEPLKVSEPLIVKRLTTRTPGFPLKLVILLLASPQCHALASASECASRLAPQG